MDVMNAYSVHSVKDFNKAHGSFNFRAASISARLRPVSAPQVLPSCGGRPAAVTCIEERNQRLNKLERNLEVDEFRSLQLNNSTSSHSQSSMKTENQSHRELCNAVHESIEDDTQTWYTESGLSDVAERVPPLEINVPELDEISYYNMKSINNIEYSYDRNRGIPVVPFDEHSPLFHIPETHSYHHDGYRNASYVSGNRREVLKQNYVYGRNNYGQPYAPRQQHFLGQTAQYCYPGLYNNAQEMIPPESFGLHAGDTVPGANFQPGMRSMTPHGSPYYPPSEALYSASIGHMEEAYPPSMGPFSPQTILLPGTQQYSIFASSSASGYGNCAVPVGMSITQYGLPHSYYVATEQNPGMSPVDSYTEAYSRLYLQNYAEPWNNFPDQCLRAIPPCMQILRDRSVSADEYNLQNADVQSNRIYPQIRRNRGNSHHSTQNSSKEGSIPSSMTPAPMNIESARGHILSMSGDQTGCRQLQQLLIGSKGAASAIFEEVKDHLCDLMTHPFGNYLFQKLLEHMSVEERTTVISLVSHKLVHSGKSLHGTRSVQKVIQMAQTKLEREKVIAGLQQGVLQLATDANGNHIIQKVLQHFGADGDSAFVFQALDVSCREIASHRYGCCVVQRALDAASYEQRLALVAIVAKEALKLMQDPFGNYVVQYVLDKCASSEVDAITRVPLGNIFALSTHKFSSNVVEKCLEKACPAVKSLFLKEIILIPNLELFIHDQYANYVLQRAFSVGPPGDVLVLTEVVRPYLSTMRNSTGGRKISLKLLKRFTDIAPSHSVVGGMGTPIGGVVPSAEESQPILKALQLQELQNHFNSACHL